MLKSILVSYLRFISRNRLPSAFGVVGLALGIACTLVLCYFIHFEVSFDGFNRNHKQIFRIVYGENDLSGSAYTSHILGTTLEQNYPGVKTIRFNNAGNARSLFKYEEKKFMESRFYFTDEKVFEVFSFDLKAGQPDCLAKPFTMAITEQAARKWFGDDDALGKSITMEWGGKTYDLAITGVLSDVPSDSHLQFDYLISMATAERIFRPNTFFTDWTADFCYTYIYIDDAQTAAEIDGNLTSLVDKNTARETSPDTHLRLQPLDRIHLYSRLAGDPTSSSDVKYLYLAACIGLLILMMSLINYANILSAFYTKRLKEIGLRKIFGGIARSVAFQFATESLITVTVAFAISLLLLAVTAPLFEELMGSRISLLSFLLGRFTWLLMSTLLVLTICLSYFLSRAVNRGPGEILYGRIKNILQGLSFRNTLVGVQVCATFVIIVFGLVVYAQLKHIQEADLGYQTGFVISIPEGRAIRDRSEAIKQELLSVANVNSIALSSSIPSRTLGFKVPTVLEGGNPNGSNEPWQIAIVSVDYDFIDVFDLRIVSGRNFSSTVASDSTQGIILNEAAVKALNWESPLGHEMQMTYNVGDGTSETMKGKIIGVVKDFHYESLHKQIEPMAFICKPFWFYYVTIKMNTSTDISSTISSLHQKWDALLPEVPFEYTFQEERLRRLYATERSWGRGITFFSIVAVFVSCFGLFGLVTFTIQTRMREMAIRKILGADALSILAKLYLSILKIVVIATIAAIPLVAYASARWLSDFAYRISLTPLFFLIGFGLILLTATSVVVGQLMKAAKMAPTDVLKSN